MDSIDLTDTEGVSDFEMFDITDLDEYLVEVPDWVDYSSDSACKIVSYDPENPRFILEVSHLLDEYCCQVVYITEDSKYVVYIIPTENNFVTVDM